MSGLRIVLVALMLAPVLSSNASFLQDNTGGAVAYQFDGSTNADAPDGCGAADPAWAITMPGTTDGMLVPGDDEVDVFVLKVDAATVGQRLDLGLSASDGVEVEFHVDVPTCGTNIALPENWPVPFPIPPAPSVGELTVTPAALASDICASTWRFKVTGVHDAPDSIFIAWTDGTEATVPLENQAGTNAFYRIDAPAIQLKGAWINLPDSWTGSFRVLEGPCDAVHGGAVYGDPPVVTPTHVEFTPVQAGHYTVVVRPEPMESPAVPMTCHFCFGPVRDILQGFSYNIDARSLTA